MIGYAFRMLTGKSPMQKKLKQHFGGVIGKTCTIPKSPAWCGRAHAREQNGCRILTHTPVLQVPNFRLERF
jgi:hypothetical protein